MSALRAAIEQAEAEHQQELAAMEVQRLEYQQKSRQAAIAALKLPFDDEMIGMLSPFTYEFLEKQSPHGDETVVCCFGHEGIVFMLWCSSNLNGIEDWTIEAYLASELSEEDRPTLESEVIRFNRNSQVYGYKTPEQLRKDFLLFLGKSIQAGRLREDHLGMRF